MNDYYAVPVVAGKRYTVEVMNGGTSYSTLYYSVGNLASLTAHVSSAGVAKSQQSVQTFTATESGEVVVRLSGNYGYQNYDYSLQVYAQP